MRLGGVGVWSGELRFARDRAAAREAIAELEQLGYRTLWLPGGTGTGRPLFEIVGELLDASRRIILASGVLSIWVQDAAGAAADFARLSSAHPDRLILGLGTSHARFVEDPARELLRRPLTAMRAYLDELDDAASPVPAGMRVLAALRDRMLALSRDRAAGAHPYLVTPEHTHHARQILGSAALLAPEQAVVLERDPVKARAIARAHLELYLQLPNYTGNMLRFGLTEEDLHGHGSDRLVDALVVWGGEEQIAQRVAEHRAAGADHVALQVLSGRRGELPLPEWRRLADLIA